MSRVLLSLLLFCLTGCDGPVFRRMGGPSAGKLRTAIQSQIPNYLAVHQFDIVSGNDGGDVRILKFDLEVSPAVPLFTPEGANPPGEEIFRLRRTHAAGERVTLQGSVRAVGTPTDWQFAGLEWRKDPATLFGRPRDQWPGSYVLEGTPEAEAAIQARLRAKEVQLELARKAKEAEAEQARQAQAEREAKIEAERQKRLEEEARIAQLEAEQRRNEAALRIKREHEEQLERRRQQLAEENEAKERQKEEERRQRARDEEDRQRRLAEERENLLRQLDRDDEDAARMARADGKNLIRSPFLMVRREISAGEPPISTHLLRDSQRANVFFLVVINHGSKVLGLEKIQSVDAPPGTNSIVSPLKSRIQPGAFVPLGMGGTPTVGDTADLYVHGYAVPVKYSLEKR